MAALRAAGQRVSGPLSRSQAACVPRPSALCSHGARQQVCAKAMGGPEGERKAISRENEPEEYWTTPSERKGANPLKDPVALIGIFAIFFPFLFVLVAIGTGAIDTSVYR